MEGFAAVANADTNAMPSHDTQAILQIAHMISNTGHHIRKDITGCFHIVVTWIALHLRQPYATSRV